MTTSSPISPDDECGVCSTKRDQHGDKNHQFNIDGDLVPLEPRPDPKKQPPQERMSPEAQALTRDPTAQMQLRLIERLTQKGLLDGVDLVYIMGGGVVADNRGQTT